MDERNFTENHTGKLVWEQSGMYYRFEPSGLPLSFEISKELQKQMFTTGLALGRLDGLTDKFSESEIALFTFHFASKEAALSSEIEGTRSTITDIYKDDKVEEPDTNKKLDNEEVKNYRNALQFALKHSGKKITEELIKETHAILLQGVRGSSKQPGEYKSKQNAIGQREDSLDSAKFVPSSPKTTPALMKNLVEYIESHTENSLFNIAITHYQFEAIHPFRDGNGRLGRLLIMLQLCNAQILKHPIIYISEYINKNRDTYTDILYNVSMEGDIEAWLMFFMKALESQAIATIALIKNIESYKVKLLEQVKETTRSARSHELVNVLFKEPLTTSAELAEKLSITTPSAWGLIKKIEKAGILVEITGKQRGKVFMLKDLLLILEGKKFEV